MLQYCNLGFMLQTNHMILQLQLMIPLVYVFWAYTFFLRDYHNKLQFATYSGRIPTQQTAKRCWGHSKRKKKVLEPPNLVAHAVLTVRVRARSS